MIGEWTQQEIAFDDATGWIADEAVAVAVAVVAVVDVVVVVVVDVVVVVVVVVVVENFLPWTMSARPGEWIWR